MAVDICKDIYDKATSLNVDDTLSDEADIYEVLGKLAGSGNNQTASEEFEAIYRQFIKNLEDQNLDLINVFRTKIGVNPEDDTTVTKKINNVDTPYPKWKDDIEKKIYGDGGKLTDIPDGLDLTDLLYRHDLYQKIVNFADGLPDLISGGLVNPNRPNAWGCNWDYGVNDTALQNYKNARTERDNYETQIRKACGLNNTGAIPNNWDSIFEDVRLYFVNDLGLNISSLPTIPVGEDLASLLDYKTNHTCSSAPCSQTHCPNSHSDYNTRYTESEECKRIKGKLNNKVSDAELDNLLNQVPNCSHSDYDTIKKERDTLKTENTQLKEHKCDCADKIKAKESEIINKIITDLSLSTERERENLLEAVISEIKNKITPPNTTDKDNKIKELEAELTKLKTPKSIKDLPISQEVKQEVIKISQELGLTKQSQARLEKATSYQELSNLQKEAFQERINNEAKDKKSAETLNYFLGALSIGSLLVLAWVLIRRSNFTPELGNKEEK